MAKKACCLALIVAALMAGVWGLRTHRVHAAPAPPIDLASPVRLQPQYAGPATSVQPVASGQVRVASLAAEDFDGDGIGDLAAGYAVNSGGGRVVLYHGSLDAFAPQSQQSADAFARGDFLPPYSSVAQVVDVPSAPDFLAAGKFIGAGGPGLLAAARGGTQVHVLAFGASGFTIQQSIDLPGTVSALGAYDLHTGGYTEAVIGVRTAAGPQMLIYTGSADGLTAVSSLPLSQDATSFSFGNLDGDLVPDVLIVAGGAPWILHGADQSLEAVRVPYSVAAAALGTFLYDQEALLQMALLSTDGTLHVLAHSGINSRRLTATEIGGRRAASHAKLRPAPEPTRYGITWQEAESFAGAGQLDGTGNPPLLLRSRVSSTAADDLLILGSGNLSMISHPSLNPGSGLVLNRVDLAGDAAAALPLRVNADGRLGLVFLKPGDTAPFVMRPLLAPGSTLNVNTTADALHAGACAAATPGQCTLREAIVEANASSNTVILVPGGTYNLTIGRGATQDYTGNTGALYVNSSVIIDGSVDGSGNPTTIVQWGTPGTGTTDLLMSVNPDILSFTSASASISNVIFQGGSNHGASGVDGDGGCLAFDTGNGGTGLLTLTNVWVQNCATTAGNGGGIAIFNLNNGTGFATLSSTKIQNNTAHQGSAEVIGGGIWIAQNASMTMSSSAVSGNAATSGGPPTGGGGTAVFSAGANSRQTTIHNSLIQGNTATGFGGGIYATAKMLIDQGSSILSNSTTPSGVLGGGGVYMSLAPADGATFTAITISGNSTTGSGGGILMGNDAGGGSLTMNFCRLANSGSNLVNDHSTASVTNNWWGTNNPASTISNPNGGATTFDPFIVLTATASPQKILVNGSTTLSADMSKDNHGATVSTLSALAGAAISFTGPVLGTIPDAQPESLNSSAQATATFNAGGTGGTGTANVTVDSYTAGVNSVLLNGGAESGSTATLNSVGVHGFAVGQYVTVSGVSPSGYNGTFPITAVTTTSFSYVPGPTGLAAALAGGTASTGIVILQPPSITASFNPAKVTPNTPSTLTLSIASGNTVPINASFTDALPTGLVVAATPGVTNTCGSSVSAAAATTSISFSNTALPTGTCAITVNVSAATDGTYSNSVVINSSDAGNGNTSTAILTVIAPPTIAVNFGAAAIPLNSSATLTFTLSNPNTNLGFTGVGFKSTVTLPSGLTTTAGNDNLTNNCGGTATAAAGSNTVNLTGVTLAAGASCNLSVSVTGTTSGVKTVSVTPTSTEAGDGSASSGSTTVASPPTISKAFTVSSIALGSSTTLTITVTNPNPSTDFTGVQFTDTLPSSGATLVVAAVPNAGNTCSGTLTANAGSATITLSGGTLAHTASCTVNVDVQGTAPGTAGNTITQVASTEGGTGGPSNTATLTVVAPPAISAAFNPTTIGVSGTSTLTFTITNPAANTVLLNGIAFNDTLSTGLQVASTPSLSNSCSGTPSATVGGTSISLTGGSIPTPGNTCTFSVNVTATQTGSFSTSTGVSSTNGGTGSTSNTATLVVGTGPAVTVSFGASTVPLNGTTSLTFSVTNPNSATALTGLGFTGTVAIPAGLQVVNPGTVNNTCGGTASATASSVSFSGGSLAASGSCSISVTVQGVSTGTSSITATATSTNLGAGSASTGSVGVFAPPTIAANFGAASIPQNGTTSLTFTITDPNAATLTGVGFTLTLPTGLTVANGSASACGGTVTTTSPTGIALANASVANGINCQFSVTVTGAVAGSYTATTGNVASTNGGSGLTASAGINVIAPPSIGAGFSASPITLNGTTTLTFTISNSNGTTLTGVGFSAILPGGLTVASATTSACGGTLTTTSPTGIALTGGAIAASGSCQFGVTVTGATIGIYTVNTGNVTSINGGTGNATSAGLTVQGNPSNTALVSSQNPSSFGQSVAFTATVSGSFGTPTGTVTFKVDGASIGTGTLVGGIASINSTALAIGTRSVTAVYSGDSTYATSTSSILSQVVNIATVTVAVQSSLNPSQFGQSVTFTATVTPPSGGATPTSSVTFKDGVTVIGSGTLSGGVATMNTSSLTTGSHSITAVYSGDANYSGATSPPLTQTVNQLTPTVGLNSSVNPSVTGQLTTFTATVSGSGATPTGTVTVTVDGSAAGSIALSGGTGTLSIALTATGSTRSIVAQYGGDTNYVAASSSTLGQTVSAAATTTAVAASSNPALSGVSVTFTATVSVNSPGQGTPSGTVTFFDGATNIGSGSLSGGVANFSTAALSVGPHSITASYGATAAFGASASSILTENISSTGTAVALNSSANPSVLGQSVTLTAHVTATGGTTPAGSVQFLVGGTNFGSPVTLDGTGTGALSTTTLPGGTNSITATYTSTNSLSGSTSGPLSQVVLVPVTVQAGPAGAQFIVDGNPYTTPQTFNWSAGSSHSLNAPSPQALSSNTQLLFANWSDAGAAGHTITVPSTATTYTASFTTQYLVQVNLSPTVGGSATGAGYYTAGATANLTATPAPGYVFANWSGDASGTANPIGFTVNAPMLVAANFTPLAPSLSVAIGARSDGTVAGTRNVNVTLKNNGVGNAFNAQIADITAIVVKTGTGSVTLASGVPGPVPPNTLSSGGGSEAVPLVFNWPSTATSASITFRMTATDASGTVTYTFNQTVTTIR